MPPMPSEPASMPMAKNNTSTGMPNLKEVFPTKSDTKSKMEPTSNMFSVVRFMGVNFLILFKDNKSIRFTPELPP
jgi:hypothetical protein